MGGITCIVRFLLLSFLRDFVISDNPTIADKPRFSVERHSYTNSIGGSQHNNKRRETNSIGGSRHNGFENTRRYTSSLEGSQYEGFKKENGEFCESAEECVINDCRGSRCGGRAEGQWCEEDNWCSDKNCYKGACHKKDAYKNIGETCVHRRECLSTRCAEDKCTGRTNGEWCKMEEWCASNHCYKSKCTAKPVDPCTVPGVTAASCLGQCAWSNGECSYSESHVWCGGHWAPSCDLCPSGNGASWCDGNCIWSSGSCILISDLSDPCVANDEVNTCTGDCAWSNGVCSYSETHVNCGQHEALSCSLCPSGHGDSWCSGECNLLNGECFRDVARDGTASQSSTLNHANLDQEASKAINGNTGGNCWSDQCSHTLFEYRPWWKVDLHNIYLIHTIVIWNTDHHEMWRLNNAELKIYHDDILVDTKNLGDMSDTRKKEFNYSGISGNIVKVGLLGTNFLHLSEVQVFGSLQ